MGRYKIKNNWLFIAIETLLLSWIISSLALPSQALENTQLETIQSYYSQGKYQQAINFLESLLLNSEGVEKAEIYCWLAASYRQRGNVSEAIKSWQKARSIYEGAQDLARGNKTVGVLVDLAQSYNELGQFRTAIPLVEKALLLTDTPENSSVAMIARGVLGDSYLIAGDYQKAIDNYRVSLDLASPLDNSQKNITTALNNLSNAYWQQSEQYLAGAEAAYQEREELEQKRFLKLAEENRQEAFKRAEEAVVNSKKGISFAAVRARLLMMKISHQDYGEEVISLLKKLPDSRRKVYELINLAKLMKNSQAIGIYNWGIEVSEKIGDLRSLSFAVGSLARLYREQGNYQEALGLTQQAILAAGQVFAQDSLYRWQWQAGHIYHQIGEVEEAKQYYRQAIATLQDIRGDLAAASQNLRLDFRDEVEPVYREYLEILLASGMREDMEEALSIFFLLQLSELENFFGDDCVEITEVINNPEKTITENNLAVIHSLILANKSYVILQLPGGFIKSYSIDIPASELEKDIELWRRQLENIRFHEYLGLSQYFYDLFIRPLEADLSAAQPKTLVFINDGIWRNVPMAALHDGEQFLVEKYPLSTSASLQLTSSAAGKKDLTALTFGLSEAIPPFNNPLPNVKLETEQVQNILGGQRFLDKDFTLKQLREQVKNSNYPIIHLATHGKFGGSQESIFLQAFDQTISLQELEQLLSSSQNSLELLTLSACQTAAGNERSVLGLAGVAIRSGVKSTLGSLWFVSDEGTVPLITDFYLNLKQGMSKAEALQQAQIQQINTSNHHPSIWSSFILIGSWL